MLQMHELPTIPGFADFDDQPVYGRCEQALLDKETLNFVIQFDSKSANSALDLDETSMDKLLKKEVCYLDPGLWDGWAKTLTASKHPATKWYEYTMDSSSNIWGPERQKKLVQVLSARYNFSQRLSGLMCSDHNKPHPVTSTPRQSGRYFQRGNKKQETIVRESVDTRSSDPEKNVIGSLASAGETMLDLSHYKMANDVWHYCSVDWGARYLCISYNSLADTTEVLDDKTGDDAESDHEVEGHLSNKPKGARNWSWLILCDDGTIISLYETQFPGQDALTHKEHDLQYAVRRNLINVFKQLSKVMDAHRIEHPLLALDIRPGLSADESSKISIVDSPSLLFYYLFDDWYSTYALVAKSKHQYAQQLETLRMDMFKKPQVHLIDRLHQYGRELAVLKRMYQSYALIIDRILARQKPINPTTAVPSNSTGRHTRQLFQESNTTARLRDESPAVDGDISTLGAPLSSSATVRFERLRDRINLFALSEIQECLDEKESLVFLNFNLLTMKESQAVERLSRITILLAKVTILFMPASLMTGYFSTQLQDLTGVYTVKTYWICFGVVMALSLIFLAIFGLASGTVEGKPIYRSLTQTVMDMGKGRWKARRAGKGD